MGQRHGVPGVGAAAAAERAHGGRVHLAHLRRLPARTHPHHRLGARCGRPSLHGAGHICMPAHTPAPPLAGSGLSAESPARCPQPPSRAAPDPYPAPHPRPSPAPACPLACPGTPLEGVLGLSYNRWAMELVTTSEMSFYQVRPSAGCHTLAATHNTRAGESGSRRRVRAPRLWAWQAAQPPPTTRPITSLLSAHPPAPAPSLSPGSPTCATRSS